MTYLAKDAFFGDEIRCEPGEKTDPTGHCERHGPHHFCETCEGYYGVPHTGIHEGPHAHPNQFTFRVDGCVCRICAVERARSADQARQRAMSNSEMWRSGR